MTRSITPTSSMRTFAWPLASRVEMRRAGYLERTPLSPADIPLRSRLLNGLRRLWPRRWSLSGYNERLGAPGRTSSRSRRPTTISAGLAGRSRPGTGPVGPRRWGGQDYNERLDTQDREEE
jgi:hypothetical protein